uniref:Uncharacterized protein n=1 Tax=Kalanchoe fedtschenkoi TaxID=63787 RepID=A0A7N0V002_KALFE
MAAPANYSPLQGGNTPILTTTFPPRRGQIKKKIIRSILNTVVSATSNTGGGDGAGGGIGGGAIPTQSADNSDTNTET